MLIDSHCHLDHLDLNQYNNSLSQLLAAAKARGVSRFLSVGVDLGSSRALIELAEDFPEVVTSVGVHPLQKELPELPEIEQLTELARHDSVVALGETGLDYFYSRESADWQQESFIRHLKAAKQLSKPVIVHTRDAREDTLATLTEYADTAVGGVLHCFTESWEMARAALDLNFYISFSGIITFNNASELRKVVKKVPLERIMVETDAPWLTPVPYRGQQNEPQYVVEVAQRVAELKGVSIEEVAEVTSRNFDQLFMRAR